MEIMPDGDYKLLLNYRNHPRFKRYMDFHHSNYHSREKFDEALPPSSSTTTVINSSTEMAGPATGRQSDASSVPRHIDGRGATDSLPADTPCALLQSHSLSDTEESDGKSMGEDSEHEHGANATLDPVDGDAQADQTVRN